MSRRVIRSKNCLGTSLISANGCAFLKLSMPMPSYQIASGSSYAKYSSQARNQRIPHLTGTWTQDLDQTDTNHNRWSSQSQALTHKADQWPPLLMIVTKSSCWIGLLLIMFHSLFLKKMISISTELMEIMWMIMNLKILHTLMTRQTPSQWIRRRIVIRWTSSNLKSSDESSLNSSTISLLSQFSMHFSTLIPNLEVRLLPMSWRESCWTSSVSALLEWKFRVQAMKTGTP